MQSDGIQYKTKHALSTNNSNVHNTIIKRSTCTVSESNYYILYMYMYNEYKTGIYKYNYYHTYLLYCTLYMYTHVQCTCTVDACKQPITCTLTTRESTLIKLTSLHVCRPQLVQHNNLYTAWNNLKKLSKK